MSELARKNVVFGPAYEDGDGERYTVTYETNYKDYHGVDQGARLTIQQFSNDSVFIEGPYIEGFLEAIRKAMST